MNARSRWTLSRDAAWLGLSVSLIAAHGAAQDGFGGARDNGLLRHQASVGYVPAPSSFTVEGFLSEHHFPVREERCEGEVCVLSAMGHGLHRPSRTRSSYLLIEPVSGIDPASFRRAPLNAGLVIDVSGSMTGEKLSWAIAASHALLDRLGPEDRVSITVFADTPQVIVPSTSARETRPLHAILDTLAVRGGTNLFDGLRAGFEEVARSSEPGRMDRVFVLTDERPNLGVVDGDSFLEMIAGHAQAGTALTVVGVGLDLGAELASTMGQLDGGAYHYLEEERGIAEIFGEDFDQRVSPVAYRVSITVTPGPGLRVADVFGVPEDNLVRHPDGRVSLRANTLFLDRRRSGVVVRLEPIDDVDAVLDARAAIGFSYVRASDGTIHTGTTEATHHARHGDALAEFGSPYHYRAYALVNFAELLRAALNHWDEGHFQEALRIMSNARIALDLDRRISGDPDLQTERELADQILGNMRADNDYVVIHPVAVEYM